MKNKKTKLEIFVMILTIVSSFILISEYWSIDINQIKEINSKTDVDLYVSDTYFDFKLPIDSEYTIPSYIYLYIKNNGYHTPLNWQASIYFPRDILISNYDSKNWIKIDPEKNIINMYRCACNKSIPAIGTSVLLVEFENSPDSMGKFEISFPKKLIKDKRVLVFMSIVTGDRINMKIRKTYFNFQNKKFENVDIKYSVDNFNKILQDLM